ncbi:MAG: hypothetical protein JWO44_1484 [Bacteroidetes bacterium]|nr:hypothetical protein [Bacteroidota bacterium]
MNKLLYSGTLLRFSAILMACLILFTQTELSQLVKLPVFLKHYSEHQQKDPGLSVLKFIAMHYYGNDMDDSDNATDAKLPFKSHTAPASFYCVLQPNTSGIRTYELNSPAPGEAYYLYKPQQTAFEIWQPPKI